MVSVQKRHIILVVIVVILAMTAASFALLSIRPKAAFLYPIEIDGYWGSIDRNGKLIIEPQFNDAPIFSDGLALVSKGNEATFETEYIDENGTIIIEPVESRRYISDFSEDLAVFYDYESRNYGYINKRGEIAIEPKFDDADIFCQGIAIVMIDNKYGYIDTNGNFLVEPRFDSAEAFSEGLANVAVDERSGFIDIKGNYVIDLLFEEYGSGSFSEGLAPVKLFNDNKYGYINKEGKFIIPPKYDFACVFSEGLGLVSIDGKYGFIDTTGNFIIEPMYEDAYPFQDGLAAVAVDYVETDAGNNWYQYIDKNGNVAIDTFYRHSYSADYSTHDFINGIALVWTKDYDLVYINKSGKVIWNWEE